MKIAENIVESIAVIEVEGNIDSKTAPEFEKAAINAIKGQGQVIIDLSKVEFLSSAGLRVLLMIYRQIKAQNGKVVLVGVSEEIQDVMSNTGFINFFIIVATIEEGIESLKQG
ncbi:STAS domain-containing protein [Runella sp. MFBS21]|jgi:anti-sigma B factor antagonist|uniref:STAS domain-containing protein n=1 Tax=Runella TaxID=105 RepID=UPI0003FFA2B2|nr:MULTISPECIES: STAS domain-containing protein [Runella]MDF7819911.1 STAS domain-containing protein [Runella sp. MFBS21]